MTLGKLLEDFQDYLEIFKIIKTFKLRMLYSDFTQIISELFKCVSKYALDKNLSGTSLDL
jgi:hypothetical protein